MDVRTRVQSEALHACSQYRHCGLAISMGVGKTFIGLRDLERLKPYVGDHPRFLVVAPSAVFKSWKEDAAKFGMSYLLQYITFCTYASLTQQDPRQFAGVYLDECHLLIPTHEPFLQGAFHHQVRILGLTGSPPLESNREKFRLIQTYCPIVYSYETDEAVQEGVLNDYRIFIHPVYLGTAKDVYVQFKNANKGWYTSEVESYAKWSKKIEEASSREAAEQYRLMRMKAMMGFPSKERYAKALLNRLSPNKTIVFANSKLQADRLCSHSVHSGNRDSQANLEAFKAGSIRQISCVDQLTAGVNIPQLTHGIIMHAFANEFKTAQKLGRFLRLPVDQTAQAHILMYRNTKDEEWVANALRNFDPQKIQQLSKPLF